ncbi:hypothetical protein FHS42_004640 [Streptomyces zagrosensis]|uniref:Uncharacterized protein n=1 Tax=Streptomyces zagrosensis TaxID=1042984 RepID=A0A7W9V198_9ACTN|nr:hypothetical protein [Streptomyces zagrosensis]
MVLVGSFVRPPFGGLGCDCGQECVGEHGQGDVSIPARIPTDLVLVEAAFVLGGLEGFLDRPARAGDADQVGDAGAVRGVGEVVGDLVRTDQVAAAQYPPLVGGPVAIEDTDRR